MSSGQKYHDSSHAIEFAITLLQHLFAILLQCCCSIAGMICELIIKIGRAITKNEENQCGNIRLRLYRPIFSTMLKRHWKNNSSSTLWRKQWLFDRFSLFFSLFLFHDCSIEPTPPANHEDSSTERERERERERDAESEREQGRSVGHYLLLTIFMCLSIAEISTRCDDIDWHAVKPSDMRLRRSPPTSTSARPPRVSSFLAQPSFYIVNVRRFIYTSYPSRFSNRTRHRFRSAHVPDGIASPSRSREQLPSRRNRLCVGNSDALAGMPPD